MLLTIRRGPSTDLGTFSKAILATDDGSQGMSFDWLELPWRDNQHDISCIPIGRYRCVAWDSPTFGRTIYRVLSVPARTDILIHPANWAGDTAKGYYSDLRGCHAPGHGIGDLETPAPHSQMQKAVLHSGDALKEILQFTGGQPIDLRIIGFGQVGV